MKNSSLICWRLIEPKQLQWADWGEDTVVFNGLSADTHLLNSMALDVLLVLSKGALPVDRLVEKLSCQWGLPSKQVTESIRGLIHNLDCLGLIEPDFT